MPENKRAFLNGRRSAENLYKHRHFPMYEKTTVPQTCRNCGVVEQVLIQWLNSKPDDHTWRNPMLCERCLFKRKYPLMAAELQLTIRYQHQKWRCPAIWHKPGTGCSEHPVHKENKWKL